MFTPAEVVEATLRDWCNDPDSDVEYIEWVEDRWAARMRQRVRSATTVWWTVGERSVRAEAYLFPGPVNDAEASLRLCLVRNASTWRARVAVDPQGDIVIRGRLDNRSLDREQMDLLLAEIYELVEVTFPVLVRIEASRA